MSEEKQRNKFQQFCKKIADFLGKVVKYAVFNPLVFLILGLLIGARLFEGGFVGMEGTTVWISGACDTFDKQQRSDLAQDQVIVASVSESQLRGVIRATREYVVCNTKEVAIDRLGPLSALKRGFIDVPEIAKLKARPAAITNYKQYEKKKLLISGLCSDATTGKQMEAFSNKVVSITSTKALEGGATEDFVLAGIRDDNKPLICNSTNITYEMYIGQGNSDMITTPQITWKGKKVFVTGTCFPDMRLYKKLNEIPPVTFLNAQKLPVEVLEAVTAENDPSNLVAFSGTVLSREEVTSPKGAKFSLFGLRIVCDQKESPLNVTQSGDPSFSIEDNKKEPSAAQ